MTDDERDARRREWSRRAFLNAGAAAPVVIVTLTACSSDEPALPKRRTSDPRAEPASTHTDVVHADTPHLDTPHDDIAHVDLVEHADRTPLPRLEIPDVGHGDAIVGGRHLDIPAPARPHLDVPHLDSSAHGDSPHTDVPHVDTPHVDTPHVDAVHIDAASR